jgi:Na+/melibiose symporter-like transporter
MPEPTSTSGAAGAALVAIGVSIAGSKYGPLATVAAAAFVGTLISLGEVQTAGKWAGAWYMFRYVLMATIVAGSLSYLVERYASIPANEILALVAFCIGWIGSRWQGLLASAIAGLQAFAGRKGEGR